MIHLEMVFSKYHITSKGDFENPFQLKDLIDKFKGLNPNYDINKLTIIDNIEDYSMKYVIEKLNE